MDSLYLIVEISYDRFISHIVFNDVAVIATLLSTRSDIIASIIQFVIYSHSLQYLQGNNIMGAAQAGNVEAVRRCLDGGTDVNSTRVIIFYMIIV